MPVILLLLFLFSFNVLPANSEEIDPFEYDGAVAANAIKTQDDAAKKAVIDDKKNTSKWERIKAYLLKTGATALNSAVRNALNTMAYDTATWLGSGNRGQKPLFIKEGWDTYLKNIADNAGGYFIEELGKTNGFAKLNLCEPNFDIKINMVLSLVQYQRPTGPACTWSKMAKNWKTEADRLKAMKAKDFLDDFQLSFDPAQNDVGIALGLQTGMMEEKALLERNKTKEREEGRGWLDIKSPSGAREGTPNAAEYQKMQIGMLQAGNFAAWSGDALVDAANIFLNQYAITAFNKFLQSLAKDVEDTTTAYSGDFGGLTDAQGQLSGGASGLQAKADKLMEPNFAVRADYDILAELTMCFDPTKAGPTNCVITDRFSQAISERKTVGEAMDSGYLNKQGIFGFNREGAEPRYSDESYPYRSMLILRKFRILPAGWEVGAQYIKVNGASFGKNITLEDMVDCFSAGDEYKGYGDDCINGTEATCWCKGLVDPNWVLKAPLNYCRREGFGPELGSNQVIGEGNESMVEVARNDNYCADEQSCIKEGKGGACQAYGYCLKERRKWDFSSDSCDAKYNTCQSFKAESGKTVAYLENTLNYSGCNIDNAGCKAYAEEFDYGNQAWEAAGSKIYFDKDAEKCDDKNEGCHEFIRTREGTGSNLLKNPSFEESDAAGTIAEGVGAMASDAYSGQKALQLTANGNLSKDVTVGPDDFSIGGERFAFSFYAKACGSNGTFGIEDFTSPLNSTPDGWTRHQLVYIYSQSESSNKVSLSINTGGLTSCLIDDIKLERGAQVTSYSGYGENSTIYEKLLPDYFSLGKTKDNICYDAKGKLKADAPEECGNFVRTCDVEEVNCELYTSLTDEVSVPAKVVAQDYCASECVGFDAYVQDESTFDTSRSEYFIPSSAKICSAEATGCEQFTNLDAVARGGEATEYYSFLRQCIKPDTEQCSEFYTWEGSDEAGYQLKVMQLKKDAAGNPDVTEDDSLECNENIYNLASTDQSYNPDCRQFYNKAGAISYHLIDNTITCSENCLAYRLTRKNIDPNITSQAACNSVEDGHYWDAPTEQCVVCKAGGTWDSEQSACVYQAIPGEGQSCTAEADGCREYGGNAGNNMRVISQYDFEGSLQDWSALPGSSVDISNESLIVGGHSMSVSKSAARTVGSQAMRGKSYVLSFIAKGQVPGVSVTAGISTSSAANFTGSATLFQGEWKRFELNLPRLDEESSDSQKLSIYGTGAFFIDDIKLTEITDRYYLIRDSWITPDSCNRDENGDPYPLFALGCDAYEDREKNVSFLHSFSRLCQDSAVGCELMIDTQNSSEYGAKTVSGVSPNVVVPADDYIYAVFDSEKQCSAIEKGCQRLGKPYQYEGRSLFTDVYLKNDPDKYSSILCDSTAVDCASWDTGNGTAYFRDPGDQVCEWRQAAGSGLGGGNWYKKKIKKCAGGNSDQDACLEDKDCPVAAPASCQQNSDCGSGNSCVDNECFASCKLETTDIACPVSTLKTFGTGEVSISQPTVSAGNHWAGACPVSQSGCTEYIDPLSKFSNNLTVNGYAKLAPSTLYVLAQGATIDNCKDVKTGGSFAKLYNLPSSNILGAAAGLVSASNFSTGLFYAGSNLNDLECRVSGTGEVRKAAVDYQIRSGVDTQSCNGMVDFEKGCVLFNERIQDGGNGLIAMDNYYDAVLTIADGNGTAPLSNPDDSLNNSDKIVKVTPDRECGEWLACEKTALDKSDDNAVCEKIGVCNKFDDNGGCDRFVQSSLVRNQTYPLRVSPDDITNLSGYSKVGHEALGASNNKISIYPNDYYQFDLASSSGLMLGIPNGGFEQVKAVNDGGTNKLILPAYGWTCQDNKCQVLNNPVAIQSEKVCYMLDGENCTHFAPEGRNVLKVIAEYDNVYPVSTRDGEEISVRAGEPYVLTAYMDTTKMSDGKAAIKIQEYAYEGVTASGTPTLVANGSPYTVKEMAKGKPWEYILAKFTPSANAKNIKIILTAEADNMPAQGDYYFDDIAIRPALNSRDGWSTPQTCRAYPEEDSLTCDYYESSGIRRKGWFGYCLEFDRYPGLKDACLMWWPVPNNTYKVNASCGDGYANGNEDCDCPPLSTNPWEARDNCSSLDRGPNPPVYPYDPYGTTNTNQYKCNKCLWTAGWCGNNVIETAYLEHCDWNESNASNSNLDGGQTCWSDHTSLSAGEAAKKDFEHPGTGSGYYYDYLHGNLDCYDNTQSLNRKNCTFTADIDCSDNLVNNVHTRKDCIDAGGIVVTDSPSYLGQEVTEADGDLIRPKAGNANKEFFCKFSLSSCGSAPAVNGKGSWTQYNNWSETTANACHVGGCSKCDDDCCGSWGSQDAGTGSHGWSNSNPSAEFCALSLSCCGQASSAFSTVRKVGCY